MPKAHGQTVIWWTGIRKPVVSNVVSKISARTKYCFALISIKMSQFTHEHGMLCIYHCENSTKNEKKNRTTKTNEETQRCELVYVLIVYLCEMCWQATSQQFHQNMQHLSGDFSFAIALTRQTASNRTRNNNNKKLQRHQKIHTKTFPFFLRCFNVYLQNMFLDFRSLFIRLAKMHTHSFALNFQHERTSCM